MAQIQVIDYTLNNGLSVVLVHDPSSPIVSARTYIKAGSIDESPLLGSGLSHYLEHIVAGGSTHKHSEETYKQFIAELGGAFNAYTTLDHTSYYINTTESEVTRSITTLYEWMFHCQFADSEFKREKEVIVKEIEKNNANLDRKFYHLSQKNTYKVHPIKHPVIGYKDQVVAITQKDLKTYYNTHYVPSNMVLAIGGNFNVDQVKHIIKSTFGSEAHRTPPTRAYIQEPIPFSNRLSHHQGQTNVTYFSMRFLTTSLHSADLYALDLLEFILVNGIDSILYKEIVEKKKLAYSINGASYTPIHTNGYFEITAETDERHIPALKREIYTILDKIKQGKFHKLAIEKSKKQKIAEDILNINHIEEKVTRYGLGMLYSDSPYFYDNYINGFKSISRKDIQRVATTYLNQTHEIITILSPNKATKKVTPALASKPSSDVKKITLDNGITLLLKHDPLLPRVHSQIMTLGGTRAETKQTNGIGTLLTELLGTASKHYSKQQILTKVEGNGANLNATLGYNTLYYTLQCLSEDFETLLPIFLDTFYIPKFMPSEITESKRQLIKQIEQRQDDWYTYSNYLFNQHFFLDHPYSLPIIGEVDTITALKADDIQSHHTTLTNTSHTIISIMGDFEQEQVIQTIIHFFKHHPISSKPPTLISPLPHSQHTKETQQHFPINQEVAALFIGFNGLSVKNESDLLKFDLLDSVLAGMSYPSGRLHHLLREEGLVYMVHASSRPGIEPGVFRIVALTSPDKVHRVQEIITEQIQSLQTALISDQEFKEGLAQLRFHYNDKESSLDQIILSTAIDELYGKGYQNHQKMRDMISKLTKNDVLTMAKKYLVNPQVMIFSKESL